MGTREIKRAIISLSDKAGASEVARYLEGKGVEIFSTGGTFKLLKDSGTTVKEITELTDFPEMMDGRIKTLNPKVHGGILAVRDNPEHMKQALENGVDMIDMLVVNLYPFEKTVAKPDVELEEAIENIDIGGPTMIRSAAKNYKYVTVITDPADYAKFVEEYD
ncbi:MAG: bifunctional phosphoribosylaminoimidazolecarboxamide formyltransferase/IMP cyclohydrolase, partial [Candidatus Delongbacteria bacterium]